MDRYEVAASMAKRLNDKSLEELRDDLFEVADKYDRGAIRPGLLPGQGRHRDVGARCVYGRNPGDKVMCAVGALMTPQERRVARGIVGSVFTLFDGAGLERERFNLLSKVQNTHDNWAVNILKGKADRHDLASAIRETVREHIENATSEG